MAVERKDIEIFFKIEGLEAYITDLETLDSVLKQVDNATAKAKDTTDQLEQSTQNFDKLEERLQTMEGGVKSLAGSLEFLTGAVGLLGLEDDPFFKELEENTLSILALARGAIDAAEGVRLLAQNQRIAAAAQAAFNTIANANPYFLLATAITAAAGALLIYSQTSEDEAVPTTEDLNAEVEKLIANFDRYNAQSDKRIDAQRRLLEAQQGELTLAQEIDFINQKISTRREDLIALDEEYNELIKNGVTETEKERVDAILAQIRATNESIKTFELEIQIAEAEDARRRRERQEAKDDTEDLTVEVNKLGAALEALPVLNIDNAIPRDKFETTTERFRRLREEIFATKQLIESANTTIGEGSAEIADTFAVSYIKAFDQIVEEPSKAANLAKRDIKAAIDFANNLNTIFTKDNEKRAERNFKLNKALSLSTAIINTAEAVTTALTDKTQPSTIARILQTVAVAAAGAAQIATIARQKFDAGGGGGGGGGNNSNLNIPPPALPTGPESQNVTIQPGQLSTGASTNRTDTPVRAYVLVSDVNSAQQANQQIENLAKL